MTSLDTFDRNRAHWPAASALNDEAVGVIGSRLVVGEASRGGRRIYFARFLYRCEPYNGLERDCFGARRVSALPARQPPAPFSLLPP